MTCVVLALGMAAAPGAARGLPQAAQRPPASTPPAAGPVVDESQLLPSGIRIEEHPLVNRPDLDRLEFTALDGQNEVELQRRHASELRRRLRPESYYGVSGGSLWVMQGEEELQATNLGQPDTAAVTRNGTPIFAVRNRSPGVTSEFRVLALYDTHWVLELAQRLENPEGLAYFSGRLFVDGVSLNARYGYQESFGFQTLAGRPFYFYKRDGRIGIAADGQEVPLNYDGVPHYGCCSAGALNPRMARNMLAFFAWRGERWYYVEIGAFERAGNKR